MSSEPLMSVVGDPFAEDASTLDLEAETSRSRRSRTSSISSRGGGGGGGGGSTTSLSAGGPRRSSLVVDVIFDDDDAAKAAAAVAGPRALFGAGGSGSGASSARSGLRSFSPGVVYQRFRSLTGSDVSGMGGSGGSGGGGETSLHVLQAATYVNDAHHLWNHEHQFDREALWWYKIHQSTYFRNGRLVLALLILSLAFFEPPTFAQVRAPVGVCEGLELVLILLFTLDLWMKSRFLLPRQLTRNRWNVALVAVMLLSLVDVMCFWTGLLSLRWMRWARPVYLCYANDMLKTAVKTIGRSLPQILDITFLMFLVVGFYTMFCMVIFHPSQGDHDDPSAPLPVAGNCTVGAACEGVTFFPTWYDGFIHMYVTLSTANFPTVMMPAYSASRWYGLIFVSYLVIALYFLANLVLAVIYSNYRRNLKETVTGKIVRERAALRLAFGLLDADCIGKIDQESFAKLFRCVKPYYSTEKVSLLFHSLDRNGDGKLDMSEFFHVVDALDTHVFKRHAHEGWVPRYKELQWFIYHPYTDFFIDLVILVNGIVIVVYSDRGYDSSAAKTFDIVFTSFFALEMVLKMLASGWRGFWQYNVNRFDFIIVLATVIALGVRSDSSISSTLALKVALLLRLFRVMRIVGKVKRFRYVAATFMHVMPAFGTYGCLQLSLYYVYSMVGMHIFEGLVVEDTTNAAILNSEFAKQENYWPNGFNTFPESIITLFELNVVNNWQVIFSGPVSATSQWAFLYFLSFNVIAVIIFTNIIVAFVLEAFAEQWESRMEQSKAMSGVQAGVDVDLVDVIKKLGKDFTGRGQDWDAERKSQVNTIVRNLFRGDVADHLTEAVEQSVSVGRRALATSVTDHDRVMAGRGAILRDPDGRDEDRHHDPATPSSAAVRSTMMHF